MIFKYAKAVPNAIRKAINIDDYAMYYRPMIANEKSEFTNPLSTFYIWRLFDSDPNSNSIKNDRDIAIMRLKLSDFIHGLAYDGGCYNYGLPSFPDLIMYLIVLIKKRDVVPNAEEELNLFRNGMKLLPYKGETQPTYKNVVDYLESFIEYADTSLLDRVLKEMVFTSSLTHDEEGLMKLEETVNQYTILVEPLKTLDGGGAFVRTMHCKITGVGFSEFPLKYEKSHNEEVLIKTLGDEDRPNNIMNIPRLVADTVVFRKYKEVTHKTTAEDIASDYAHVLKTTPDFKNTYHVLFNGKEMRQIESKIKELMPSKGKCTTSTRLYSTEVAEEKGQLNFKVKIRIHDHTLHDSTDNLKRIFNILSDIDSNFHIITLSSSMDYNALDATVTMHKVLTEYIPEILDKAMLDELQSHTARADVIQSLREQSSIIEGFRPTKIGSVYKKLDDDVFNLLAPFYLRKSLILTVNTDTLKPLNKLKLYGLDITALEYSYHNWEEVLEYLQENHNQ